MENKRTSWNKGKKASDITRQKISQSLIGSHRHLGIPCSEETKNKISQKLKGRKLPLETRQKMSKSRMGHKHGMINKKHSYETIQKMSISGKQAMMKYPNRGFSKQGLSRWNTGKKYSFELRKKLSMAHTKEKEFTGFRITKNQRLMQSSEYKQWRLSVFQRDNFTCVNCKQVGKTLEAHHIKPKSKFPQFCFDVDNGVTLCIECHILLDEYRGKFIKKEKIKNMESD